MEKYSTLPKLSKRRHELVRYKRRTSEQERAGMDIVACSISSFRSRIPKRPLLIDGCPSVVMILSVIVSFPGSRETSMSI